MGNYSKANCGADGSGRFFIFGEFGDLKKMERLALALILVFAPHTKIPIAEWIYPFRPADFILMAGALLFIRW